MKARALLILGLVCAGPSSLFAQAYPEPPVPEVAVAAQAPAAPRAPRAALTPRVPRVAAAPSAATAVVPALPSAIPEPEELQSTTPKPAAPPTLATPAAVPVALVPARALGQMVNVRIDVTLTDSKGVPKTLTMTVADGESAMNRTMAAAIPTGQSGYVDYSFNADASPAIVGNRIRLRLTADAVVLIEGDKPLASGPGPKLALRQSQVLVLNDGQALEIARSADPVSERTFTLSVKATIQR